MTDLPSSKRTTSATSQGDQVTQRRGRSIGRHAAALLILAALVLAGMVGALALGSTDLSVSQVVEALGNRDVVDAGGGTKADRIVWRVRAPRAWCPGAVHHSPVPDHEVVRHVPSTLSDRTPDCTPYPQVLAVAAGNTLNATAAMGGNGRQWKGRKVLAPPNPSLRSGSGPSPHLPMAMHRRNAAIAPFLRH